MQAEVSFSLSQLPVKVVSIDLDEPIRVLIKLMVDETDPVTINALGTALEQLLVLERVTAPTRVEAFEKR